MTSWTHDRLTHVLIDDSRGHSRTTCVDGRPRSSSAAVVWAIIQSRDAAVAARESDATTCLWCVVAIH